MNKNDGYIYSEKDQEQIQGPFMVRYNKWCYSFEKRMATIRRLFSRPAGRMTERIIEYPLVIAVMTKLNKGSRIADIGGASSLFGLNLVYLGHEVHVLDLRSYPLQHPDLISKQIDIFDNDLPDSYFDAICCISVIEHVGLDRYGGKIQKNGDFKMADEIKRICRPDGTVVISGPYGRGHDPIINGKPNGYRIYDKTRLDRLLDGFTVESLRFFVMTKGCWIEEHREIADNVSTRRPVDAVFVAQLRVKK